MKKKYSVPIKIPKKTLLFERDIDKKTFNFLLKEDVLSIDTETGGLDFRKNKLLLIQVCTSENNIYLIRHPNSTSSFLIRLFQQTSITWIFHHAMFDLKFLQAGTGSTIKGRIECTKTFMKIVHPELRSGLASALRQVKNIILKKDIKHEWDIKTLSKEQLKYAIEDVINLQSLFKELKIRCNPNAYLIYKKAISAIQNIAEIEIEGYTDLFKHEQHDIEKTLKDINWWMKIPKPKIISLQ